MPYSASALGVLPPLWSSAAKKPWPVLIFSYCVVFTVSFSRAAVAVVHLAGGVKRADHQVPDELSSSFHHRLGGNVEGELLDGRERLPGDDDRPVHQVDRRPGTAVEVVGCRPDGPGHDDL